MRVAVVGGGIAGIAAAHYAQHFAEVTLYESNAVLGGHTDTHNLFVDDRTYPVDSGFIVFNAGNYPLFSRWLADLRVHSKPTVMSFAVSTADGLEYGTTGLPALFCQPGNLAKAGFLAMLRDIRRFYGRAASIGDDSRTLAEFVADEGYSRTFFEAHLLPMCAAIWSAPRERARGHGRRPRRRLHGQPRPARTAQPAPLAGGGRRLERVSRSLRAPVPRLDPALLPRPPRRPRRARRGRPDRHRQPPVRLRHLRLPQRRRAAPRGPHPGGGGRAGRHPLRSRAGRWCIPTRPAMPRSRRAWSSWNVKAGPGGDYAFTYWMNRLQGIGPGRQFFVTLNPLGALDNAWVERDYRHPVFDLRARAAQRRRPDVDTGRTRYCGAYWGWGFHEDAFRSGYEAARQIADAAPIHAAREAV